jgi:hypothetical protein
MKNIKDMIEYYEERLRKYKNNVDYLQLINKKKSDIESIDKTLEYQKEKEEMLKLLEKQSRMGKDNKNFSVEKNIKVLNNISSALYEQKNLKLGENLELENKYKHKYLKRKKIEESLDNFNDVVTTTSKLMEKKLTKMTIRDLNSILDRTSRDNQNLKVIFYNSEKLYK